MKSLRPRIVPYSWFFYLADGVTNLAIERIDEALSSRGDRGADSFSELREQEVQLHDAVFPRRVAGRQLYMYIFKRHIGAEVRK